MITVPAPTFTATATASSYKPRRRQECNRAPAVPRTIVTASPEREMQQGSALAADTSSFPSSPASATATRRERQVNSASDRKEAKTVTRRQGVEPPSSAEEAEEESACVKAKKCVSMCAAYGKICSHTAKLAGEQAAKALDKLTEGSSLFSDRSLDDLPRIDASDVTVTDDKLGEGGFSVVKMCKHKGQTLAHKSLKRRIMADPETFCHGAADLVTEAMMLHALRDCENVVRLHGVGCLSDASRFFLVLDKLDGGTLDALIHKTWRGQLQTLHDTTSFLNRHRQAYKHQLQSLLAARLESAVSIASVLSYLHTSKRMVYRDLKPDNIGVDSSGTLKLFDFGLARELKGAPDTESGKYNMTGQTGSRRYMAPEVANGAPYDQSVDVYSFGILLWELSSCEKPFDGYSSYKHQMQVVDKGERPTVLDSWPVELQWLLRSCWSGHSSSRPSFGKVKEVLDEIVCGIRNSVAGGGGGSKRSQTVGSSNKAAAASTSTFGALSGTNGGSAPSSRALSPPPGGFKSIQKPSKLGEKRGKTLPPPVISPPTGGFKSIQKPSKLGGFRAHKSHGSKPSSSSSSPPPPQSPVRSTSVGHGHGLGHKRLAFGGFRLKSPRKDVVP